MTSLTQPRQSRLSWLVLGFAATQGVILLTLGLLLFSVHRLAQKAPPSLVQTESGIALRVSPVAAAERTPATIQRFVATTVYQLMTWKGSIADDGGEMIPDPGVEIETDTGSGKVTTVAMAASMALSEEFRLPMLAKIAELTPPEIFSNRKQVVLVIDDLSQPEAIADDQWTLTMLAHLNVFDASGSLQQTISFNRTVTVRATHVPLVPEGETPVERAVYSIRQAGLEITSIHEFTANPQ